MKVIVSLSSKDHLDASRYFNANALHSAFNQPPHSRVVAVWMSPKDFLSLCRPGKHDYKAVAINELLDKGVKFDSIPFLGVTTDEQGNVSVRGNGDLHEGRHRCRALIKQGVERVPVLIQSTKNLTYASTDPSGNKDDTCGVYRWGTTDKRPELLIGYDGFSIPFPEEVQSPRLAAASDYAKGDKVAYKESVNEWYLGTISSVGRTGIYTVTLLRGDSVKTSDLKQLKKVVRGRATKAYTTKQVVEMTKKITIPRGKTWVIGDVHGCLGTLKSLHKSLMAGHTYLLGDYIDRGPDSRGVLNFLMLNTDKITALSGNHEQMLLQCLKDPTLIPHWLKHGGAETLQAFGVKDPAKIPKKYIDFIKQMPLHKQIGDFVLSHAGANFHSKKDPLRDTATNNNYLVWNREVKPPKDKHGVTLLVGHTVTKLSDIHKSGNTSKIFLDGGCAYGGHLVAFCLETHQFKSSPYKG